MKKSIPTLATLIVVALACGSILAQPGGPRYGPPDPEERMDRLAARLDLSTEQRDALEGLFAEHRASMEAGRDAMAAAREALRERVHAEDLDEAAIRGAAAAVAALEADRAVARAQFLQGVRGILSAEQFREFERAHEMRRERVREHRRDFRHRPGPRGRRGF